MDRKTELERKKQKLEEMRKERKRIEEEKSKPKDGSAPVPMMKDLRSETEDILKDLGIPLAAQTSASPHQAAESKQAAGEAVSSAADEQLVKKSAVLTVSKVTQTNIPPKEIVTYAKETQTPKEVIEKEARPLDYYALTYVDSDEDGDSMEVGVDTPPPGGPGGHKLPHTAMHEPAESTADGKQTEKQPPPPPRELSEEEKKKIMMSDEFTSFFLRSARFCERALSESVDIFTDYVGTDDEDQDKDQLEGEQLKLNRVFVDDRWSKHRTVTSLDWSTQFPELLLTSYDKNLESPNEPDGAVLVWNTKYKKDTPEFVLHCQSAVTSACFAKFHPNLIIGGTYSGQIVMWDNRSNKHTPVQRTPLSSAVHTHPVFCTNVIGTQNAHNLASLSTDGKMCYWSLDMMSQPQDSVELQYKQAKNVAAICSAFPPNDFNNFFVGTEDCAVYSGCRHGSKAGVNELYEGHQGPVTAIDCHAVTGSIDFSHYFISSSFDWTVKLWNSKEMKPLHSFEDYSEYVYDCRWSPVHPALFATVDGSGRLDLWNLNMETEVPSATKYMEGNAALNKCRWHQAGLMIATGDDAGRVEIFDVGEAIAAPRAEEWTRFSRVLQDLKAERADREEEEQHVTNLSQSPMR